MRHNEVEHRQLERNGVSLHLACQGAGPLVVMCHGYPGLWYSWRHQMSALARAGYTAVALDMRGYGRSSRPADRRRALYPAGAAGNAQPAIIGFSWGALTPTVLVVSRDQSI